jgi:signal transduction histidine kinase
MRRRLWPIGLSIAAIVVLGSYLAFTRYLFREIREINENYSRIFSLVQRGLLAGNGTDALLEIQGVLTSLDLPIVVFNDEGDPYAASLPFEPDLDSEEGRARILEWARIVERRSPQNVVRVPDVGRVVFGEPPLVRYMRWVPVLQVVGGVVLLAIAVMIVRADLRAERERLWAAMARELAHQMGTPLSSLAGWIEVLGMRDEERAGVVSNEHIADVIATDVERLERVSRRFELIGRPPALEPVSLSAIVGELTRYFGPRLPRLGNGIQLRVRVADRLPMIQANPVLLIWALENVVKNAVDALAGRGGRITIIAHGAPSGDALHLHIADNGPGIAPGMRDRIFEPGVTTKAGGWGVGLSLTQRIIEQLHGGRVSVRARRRGGTVFDVTLPVEGGPRRRRLLRA